MLHVMRKLLLLLTLALLPVAASAGTPARKVSKTKITSVISEARRYDGVEVVRLGKVATAAIKGLIRASASEDPDAREALRMMRGIKNLTVLDSVTAIPPCASASPAGWTTPWAGASC